MKMHCGSEGIAPRILHLDTRRRWVVTFTLWPLYAQRKSPCYPLARRLAGPQSRCEECNRLWPVCAFGSNSIHAGMLVKGHLSTYSKSKYDTPVLKQNISPLTHMTQKTYQQ